MQLQLKQVEIVEALKQYIAKQGLSLAGKKVDISFTAGRREAGLSADIVIEDASDIPGFTDASGDETPSKPVLSVVKSEPEATPATKDEPAVGAPAEQESEAVEAAAPAKTTSLFG